MTGEPPFVAAGARQVLQMGIGRSLAFDDRPEFSMARAVTLEAWVKPSNLNCMPVVISHGHWQNAGYFIQVIGGSIRFHVVVDGAAMDCDGGSIEVGKWYHIAGAFDGKESRIFLNGQRVGARTLPPGAKPSFIPYHGPLYICHYDIQQPEYELQGQLGGAWVYSGAKDDAAIKADFEAAKASLLP